MSNVNSRFCLAVACVTFALLASTSCRSSRDVVNPPAVQCDQLIISEYIEGSGNNKGIELFNGTANAIDLAARNFVYQDYHNGSTVATHVVALAGIVAAGGTFKLCHSNWALAAACDQQDLLIDFNGNDVVVLREGGGAGVVVDSIGRIGEDPGLQWGTNPNTLDSTLRRNPAVTDGDTDTADPYDPAAEWSGAAQNDVSDFGAHVNTCP